MKDKIIEEMAKVLDGNCGECYTCKYFKHKGTNCTYLLGAEYLYNAGYRKIHENAVVLMGTETEQRFEDLMVAFDEMGFMPNTTHPFPEEYVETWKQRLIFVFGQLRKETAEKFAERLKEVDIRLVLANRKYSRSDTEKIIKNFCKEFKRKVDEICKEITEEK